MFVNAEENTKKFEIKGPYSFSGANGVKTPVYIFMPGGEKKIIGEATLAVDGGMDFDVQLQDEFKDIETGSFEFPMRFTFFNRPAEPKINWGFNCLTVGIHHGRPETIWNLTLVQASYMFREFTLRDLVLARIYNDAMQFVENGTPAVVGPVIDQEWADKLRVYAEEHYRSTLQHKVGEISQYYQSGGWQDEQQRIVERVRANKLNPHFDPRHPHDSINMLCRILGTKASRAVSS